MIIHIHNHIVIIMIIYGLDLYIITCVSAHYLHFSGVFMISIIDNFGSLWLFASSLVSTSLLYNKTKLNFMLYNCCIMLNRDGTWFSRESIFVLQYHMVNISSFVLRILILNNFLYRELRLYICYWETYVKILTYKLFILLIFIIWLYIIIVIVSSSLYSYLNKCTWFVLLWSNENNFNCVRLVLVTSINCDFMPFCFVIIVATLPNVYNLCVTVHIHCILFSCISLSKCASWYSFYLILIVIIQSKNKLP